MTREEAIAVITNSNLSKVEDVVIKAIFYLCTSSCDDDYIKGCERCKIFDKIRTEIDEQYDRVYPYNISCAQGLEMALEIIDKYKAESEEV